MNKTINLILALVLPPVGVYAKAGLSWHLALNVFFCFALYLPAVVHAVWFVARRGRVGSGDGNAAVSADEPMPGGQERERREPSFS